MQGHTARESNPRSVKVEHDEGQRPCAWTMLGRLRAPSSLAAGTARRSDGNGRPAASNAQPGDLRARSATNEVENRSRHCSRRRRLIHLLTLCNESAPLERGRGSRPVGVTGPPDLLKPNRRHRVERRRPRYRDPPQLHQAMVKGTRMDFVCREHALPLPTTTVSPQQVVNLTPRLPAPAAIELDLTAPL